MLPRRRAKAVLTAVARQSASARSGRGCCRPGQMHLSPLLRRLPQAVARDPLAVRVVVRNPVHSSRARVPLSCGRRAPGHCGNRCEAYCKAGEHHGDRTHVHVPSYSGCIHYPAARRDHGQYPGDDWRPPDRRALLPESCTVLLADAMRRGSSRQFYIYCWSTESGHDARLKAHHATYRQHCRALLSEPAAIFRLPSLRHGSQNLGATSPWK